MKWYVTYVFMNTIDDNMSDRKTIEQLFLDKKKYFCDLVDSPTNYD